MSDRAEMLPMRAAERLGRLAVWAAEQGGSKHERAVLQHLILIGDEHLSSFWSYERIADATGWSKRMVGDAVRSLEARDLIRRRPRKRSDNTRSTDRITVLAPRSLLVIRQNAQELAAVDHDGDIGAVYGLNSGVAHTATRSSDGVAPAATHNVPLSRDIERDESSARHPVPRRRSSAERIGAKPRPLAAVLQEAAA